MGFIPVIFNPRGWERGDVASACEPVIEQTWGRRVALLTTVDGDGSYVHGQDFLNSDT
jgi:hypothetical protein